MGKPSKQVLYLTIPHRLLLKKSNYLQKRSRVTRLNLLQARLQPSVAALLFVILAGDILA